MLLEKRKRFGNKTRGWRKVLWVITPLDPLASPLSLYQALPYRKVFNIPCIFSNLTFPQYLFQFFSYLLFLFFWMKDKGGWIKRKIFLFVRGMFQRFLSLRVQFTQDGRLRESSFFSPVIVSFCHWDAFPICFLFGFIDQILKTCERI